MKRAKLVQTITMTHVKLLEPHFKTGEFIKYFGWHPLVVPYIERHYQNKAQVALWIQWPNYDILANVFHFILPPPHTLSRRSRAEPLFTIDVSSINNTLNLEDVETFNITVTDKDTTLCCGAFSRGGAWMVSFLPKTTAIIGVTLGLNGPGRARDCPEYRRFDDNITTVEVYLI